METIQNQHIEVKRESFTISSDPKLLNVDFVHKFLREESYWAKNIPREVVQKSIDHALCYGVYEEGRQVGFARVITDYSTVAYLSDIFIIESYRGKGLSKWLVEVIMSHPELQHLRRWMLLTLDAHDLYRKFGFEHPKNPEWYMEKVTPNVYQKRSTND